MNVNVKKLSVYNHELRTPISLTRTSLPHSFIQQSFIHPSFNHSLISIASSDTLIYYFFILDIPVFPVYASAMRYRSGDFNCRINVIESQVDSEGFLLADIDITHTCLIETRENRHSDCTTIHSRSSGKDVCLISAPDDRLLGLNHMSHVKVKVLEDSFCVESTEAPDNFFGVSIPIEDCGRAGRLHPDLEDLLLNALAQRKREDDAEVEQFMKSKVIAFNVFETEISAQAAALSSVALAACDASGSQSKSTVAPAADSTVLVARTATNSPSSTSSDRPRKHKKSVQIRKRTPSRSASSPVPKPVLITQERKSSLSEPSKKDGVSFTATSKHVMFSDQEPIRIESPHVFDPSETEEDAGTFDVEQEDLFDMDEQIPVIPISTEVPPVSDLPGTGAVPVPVHQGSSFGRQEDRGLSGSFKIRNLDKYEFSSKSSSEEAAQHSRVPDRSEQVNLSSTSAPKDIIVPPMPPISAPLSSVKDLPAFSSSLHNLESDSLDDLDDYQPPGVDRKMMWQRAVATSLRLSGLTLPPDPRDDLDLSIRTGQGVRG